MKELSDELIASLVNFCCKTLVAVIIIVIGFKLINVLMKHLKKGRFFNHLEKSSQTFMNSILTITFKSLILLIAITELGISTSSIITLLASAGLAFGLALQGGLSNIAGGVTIMLFKPFKVADFIDTHSDSGTVKEINIFHTILETYDNRLVVIPNGVLANTTIVNYTASKNRLLDITVTVSYDSNLDKVKEVLTNLVINCKYRLPDKDYLVALKEHGDNALIFTVRLLVKNDDYWNAKFELLEQIKREFDKEKIIIPYPQLDVHLDK